MGKEGDRKLVITALKQIDNSYFSSKNGLTWNQSFANAVYSQTEPLCKPHRASRELFHSRKGSRSAVVNKESIGGNECWKHSDSSLAELWQSLIGWTLARWEKEVFLLSLGLHYCQGAWALPILASHLFSLRFGFINFLLQSPFSLYSD